MIQGDIYIQLGCRSKVTEAKLETALFMEYHPETSRVGEKLRSQRGGIRAARANRCRFPISSQKYAECATASAAAHPSGLSLVHFHFVTRRPHRRTAPARASAVEKGRSQSAPRPATLTGSMVVGYGIIELTRVTYPIFILVLPQILYYKFVCTKI
ncbi:hypothetical protein EVAR_63411_1 [Eumeta japonica]|uniref:Uncharacterized protein n=1 Tax=Eumeta variegata TaxID=151549 RepID=A0A4C1YXU1_EUMVA|nr:hypothetical protein EVAR_63411_1 [Eumeta japonica]